MYFTLHSYKILIGLIVQEKSPMGCDLQRPRRQGSQNDTQ